MDTPTDDWTWEDVYNASKAITDAGKADGVYGYAMNTSNNQDGWYNFIYDYGGQVITDDHKGTTIGSDASKAGMEMVRKILTTAVPQTMVAESGTDSLFQSNVVGMITQGSWMVNSFYSAEGHENYKWAVLPYADVNGNGSCDAGERQSCYNGLGWAIAANTEHPDEAYSLISYFASEEGQKKQTAWICPRSPRSRMTEPCTSAPTPEKPRSGKMPFSSRDASWMPGRIPLIRTRCPQPATMHRRSLRMPLQQSNT